MARDPFAYLPAPLPLLIMLNLPDFTTLQQLLAASPDANAVFRRSAAQIIRTIALFTSIATDPREPDLYDLLECLARIRSRSIPDPTPFLTEDDPPYTFINFSEDHLDGHHNEPLSAAFRIASPHILYSIVATASNVELLTSRVLNELLSRTATLKPAHLIDTSESLYASNGRPMLPRESWPVGKTYKLPERAFKRPPSRIEAFRVRRSLWMLVLAIDLREYAPWVLDFRLVERPLNVEFMFTWGGRENDQVLEIFAVGLCLEEIAWEFDELWEDTRPPAQHPIVKEQPRSWNWDLVLPRMPICNIGAAGDMSKLILPTGLSDVESMVDELMDNNTLARCQDAVGNNSRELGELLRIGLCIWDKERLWDLGLGDSLDPSVPSPTENELLYSYCSLLSQYQPCTELSSPSLAPALLEH